MSKNDTIRVAAAQIKVKSRDVQANVAKHLEYIAHAKKEKVDVLLFPEYSLCGILKEKDFLNITMQKEDPIFKELQKASEEMTSIVGFAEEGYAAQFYNSCILLQNNKDSFIHRKMNLCTYGYWEEGKYFAQGRYLESFKLKGQYTGVTLICSDMWNPALVHLATLHGATIIFSPIASCLEAVGAEFSNPNNWNTTLKFYSMIYGLPIVMANIVGETSDATFWGGSCIVDAFGNIKQNLGNEEGLIIEDLDYNDICKARFALPTVRDSNFTLIQRELNRISRDLGIPAGIREDKHDFGS